MDKEEWPVGVEVQPTIIVESDWFEVEEEKPMGLSNTYYRLRVKESMPWHINYLLNPNVWHRGEEMIDLLDDLREQIDIGFEIEMWLTKLKGE